MRSLLVYDRRRGNQERKQLLLGVGGAIDLVNVVTVQVCVVTDLVGVVTELVGVVSD